MGGYVRVAKFISLLNTLVYWLLLCLGILELYRGEVVAKFRFKRTNFAEHEVEVAELPTILTYIEDDLRSSPWAAGVDYGKDLNISFGIGTSEWINLTQGENSFADSPLKILFEIQHERYPMKMGKSRKQVRYFCNVFALSM